MKPEPRDNRPEQRASSQIAQVDEKGDPKTVVVATPDMTADYAIVITLTGRKSVKTIRGQSIE